MWDKSACVSQTKEVDRVACLPGNVPVDLNAQPPPKTIVITSRFDDGG